MGPELYFVEYHIGIQLCSLFKLKVNLRTPHTDQPSEVYSHVLKLIKKYKITVDELATGSVNMIYKRIILEHNDRDCSARYYRIFSGILPSYLQSFNFKLHKYLLPVNTLFREYSLDNDTVCYFCFVGPESILHLFGSCEKLKVLWKIASETISFITGKRFDFSILRANNILDLVSC